MWEAAYPPSAALTSVHVEKKSLLNHEGLYLPRKLTLCPGRLHRLRARNSVIP